MISMDSTWQALETNGKLFSILESFFELTTFFKNNSHVVVSMQGGGGICAE